MNSQEMWDRYKELDNKMRTVGFNDKNEKDVKEQEEYEYLDDYIRDKADGGFDYGEEE